MAVSFRSKNEEITTKTGNSTIVEPASAASGDALIAFALADIDGANDIGVPAGWSTLYGPTRLTSTRFAVSYLIRGGSAPALTWTISGSSKYREVQILCLTGAAALTLDSQSSAGSTGNGSLTANKPDAPATTAVAASSMAVTGGYHYDGSFSAAWSVTGYTIRTRNTVTDDSFMGTKSLGASGVENPAQSSTGNNSVLQDFWNGFTITFTDAGGGGGATITYPELERGIRGLTRGVVPGLARSFVRRDRIFVPAYAVVGDLRVAA